METLGEYLKSERESQGITLEEVAKATKIRKTILKAMEDNKYDALPPRVFAQGFLRNYASYLGLDEAEVVKRFQDTLETLEINNGSENGEEGKPARKVLSPFLWLVIVVGCAVASVVWYFGTPQEKKELSVLKERAKEQAVEVSEPLATTGIGIPKEEGAPEIAEEDEIEIVGEVEVEKKKKKKKKEVESKIREDEIGEAAQEEIVALEEAGQEQMVLRVVATESSWIKFQLDQDKPFEVILKAGESYRVSADDTFNLRIGNAGGIELFLNERALGNPGERGEVVNVTLPE